MIGRVQIQANDVPHLLDEEWIGGELEPLRAMRLYGEGLKDPVHGGLREPVGFGRLSDAPVGSGGRARLQRAPQQRGHRLVRQGARPPRLDGLG